MQDFCLAAACLGTWSFFDHYAHKIDRLLAPHCRCSGVAETVASMIWAGSQYMKEGWGREAEV